METKFTKGEWTTHYDGVCCGGVLVARKTGREKTTEEGMANLNLMASAPKMYEMLESVIGELYMLIDEVNDQRASHINSTTETEPDYHDMETIHNIQVLLAEARGEK